MITHQNPQNYWQKTCENQILKEWWLDVQADKWTRLFSCSLQLCWCWTIMKMNIHFSLSKKNTSSILHIPQPPLGSPYNLPLAPWSPFLPSIPASSLDISVTLSRPHLIRSQLRLTFSNPDSTWPIEGLHQGVGPITHAGLQFIVYIQSQHMIPLS